MGESNHFPMSGGSREQASLARPVLLELVPLGSLISTYAVSLVVFGPWQVSPAGIVPLVLAVGFLVSGLGWFSIGEPSWGWRILCVRLVVVIAAIAMASWYAGNAIGAALCDSDRCSDGYGTGPGPLFLGTLVLVWGFALLSPLASAVALVIHMRREPQG